MKWDPTIMGKSPLTADQIVAWYRSTGRPDPAQMIRNGDGPSLERLARYYVEIGEKEGVRGDIAFAQAVLETGNFTNSDSDRNNFAGIGHYDNAPRGFDYPSVAAGVQAHIQQLKRVARGDNVRMELRPNYSVPWGGRHVRHWSGLSRNWTTDAGYWPKIASIYGDLRKHAGKHPGGGGRRGRGHGHDIRPWRVPPFGRTVKVSVTHLKTIAEELSDCLAVIEHVHHRCQRELAELGKVQVAGDRLEAKLRTQLDDAINEWHGIRRLPYLLNRDIGFVVEVRRRVQLVDTPEERRKGYYGGRLSAKDAAANRRTVDRLVQSLAGRGRSKPTIRRTNELMDQLFRRDRRSDHLDRHLPVRPRPRPRLTGLQAVRLGADREYHGTQAIMDQFVVPFMLRRKEFDVSDIVSRKRDRKFTADGNISDHWVGNKHAYAVDFGTFTGEDDARALAKALGIKDWAPGAASYRRHDIVVDGRPFSVQILWAVEGHFNHIHVGIRTGRS